MISCSTLVLTSGYVPILGGFISQKDSFWAHFNLKSNAYLGFMCHLPTLILHEINKTIKEVKRKRIIYLFIYFKPTKTHYDVGVNHGKLIFTLVKASFFFHAWLHHFFLLRAFLFLFF